MSGIHHVTAISGKAARNLDFYARVIGLRFVKKTVNFDDPGTYHLYYGDRVGHPGTILTFFPWEHAAPGRGGVGLAQQTTFRVPESAIGYWTHRLVENGVTHEAPEKRFGDTVLSFTDPDGMSLALVGVAGAEAEPAWSAGTIPAEHAVRGFHGVTLMVEDAARTAAVLTDVLGFKDGGRDGTLGRFCASEAVGGVIDIREAKGFLPGRLGRGSVHHIAFRAADDAEPGGDGAKARRRSRLAADPSARPAVFPLGLFPRAGRHSVRDRNRRSGLCRRRAGRDARPRFEAAAVSRGAAQGDRSRAARTASRGTDGLMALSFIHRFEKGAEPDARPLLLLHGTGGDENDLIPLGRMIVPEAPLLSPRGKVLENGMPRFFRRFAEGRFDEDDVRLRAQELADFIEQARTHYGIAPPIALGYSNGANIAAALLLLHPQTLAGAILLRATLPLSQTPPVDLTGKPVLIDSGASDPMMTPEGAARLAARLQQYGANVEHRTLPSGHEVSQADVTIAQAWLRSHAQLKAGN